MKANERPHGMSLLDFLWANYADFLVSNTITDDNNTILTLSAILALLKEFKAINTVLIVDKDGLKYLLVLDTNNNVLVEQPIPSGITITNFGKRKVTLEDRNKGCELPLNSEVYFILLNNGNEYLAPIDKYKGAESRTIISDIVDNSVYAELKISNRSSIISLQDLLDGLYADLNLSNEETGVLLSKTPKGLEGNIILQNSDKFVKFALLTIDEYELLSKDNKVDETTMYFIKGARFFYFGKYMMAGSTNSLVLDNYYTKYEIDNKLEQYVSKIELNDYLNWKQYD